MKELNEYLIDDINDPKNLGIDSYIYYADYGKSSFVDIVWVFNTKDLSKVLDMVDDYQVRIRRQWYKFTDLFNSYLDNTDQYTCLYYSADIEEFYVNSFQYDAIKDALLRSSTIKDDFTFEDFIKFTKVKKTILRKR